MKQMTVSDPKQQVRLHRLPSLEVFAQQGQIMGWMAAANGLPTESESRHKTERFAVFILWFCLTFSWRVMTVYLSFICVYWTSSHSTIHTTGYGQTTGLRSFRNPVQCSLFLTRHSIGGRFKTSLNFTQRLRHRGDIHSLNVFKRV